MLEYKVDEGAGTVKIKTVPNLSKIRKPWCINYKLKFRLFRKRKIYKKTQTETT